MARHTSETFRHGTTSDSNGNTLYDAPIEICGREDLDNYRIEKKDCVAIRFGKADRRTVYFIRTPDRRLADFLWQELERDHYRKAIAGRCMVPGKQNIPNRCPSSNSCADCPYGRAEEKWRMTPLSLEQLLESAYEKEWADEPVGGSCETEGSFRVLLDEMREELDQTDPRLMAALRMREIDGYSTAEIAGVLGCSPPRVYQLLDTAKKLARAWL